MKSHNAKPNYTFAGTMTEMETSSREWHGESGFISKAMLLKFIANLTLPIYYSDSPPAMVNAIRKILSETGIGR